MATMMSGHRSSLFKSYDTGAGWDWSSLDDVSDTGLHADGDEDEEMEDSIVVAAGPSTPLPGFHSRGKTLKREIVELSDSDGEDADDGMEGIMHDEIVVASSSHHSHSKCPQDDQRSISANKKIKIESPIPAPDVKKPGSGYLHSILASPATPAASSVAQLRSPVIENDFKPARFGSPLQSAAGQMSAARTFPKKPAVPFIEIEDSDEEMIIEKVPPEIIKVEGSVSNSCLQTPALDQNFAAQKDRQRLTSLRLRREAGERKMREASRAGDVDAKGLEDWTTGDDHSSLPIEDNEAHQSQQTKTLKDVSKNYSTADLSTSLDGSVMTGINPVPALTSMFRKTAKPDPVLQLRPPTYDAANAQILPPSQFPRSATTFTTHVPSLVNTDGDEQRMIRAAKAKQREENVAVQIRAQGDAARKAELAVREAREKREAEEKAELDAEVAREVKRKEVETKKREDEAKRREDDGRRREDQWKRAMERNWQEEADKRQKIFDDLAAQKVAQERQERMQKETEARKREEDLRRKQAEVRSVFASVPATEILTLPPAMPYPGQQKVAEPMVSSIPKAEDGRETMWEGVAISETAQHVGEVVQPCTDVESKASRDERVRLMKERNARNKVAAAEDEPSPAEQTTNRLTPFSVVATNPAAHSSNPATLTSTTGPMSLHSAAGTAAVANSQRLPHVHDSAFSLDEEYQNRRYAARLGTITVADIKLFVWSEEGLPWEDIRQMHAGKTGRPALAISTLRRRSSQIRDTLLELTPAHGILNRAGAGEHEALDQLNALVDARRTSSGVQQPSPNPRRLLESPVKSAAITASDVKLVRLRDRGMIWAHVVEEAETMGMPWRSEGTLRSRYRQAKDLIQRADVDKATLDQVEAGDQGALDLLNAAVRSAPLGTTKASSTPDRPYTAKYTPQGAHNIDPTLGEIVPHDIQLMQWRDSGMTFSVITEKLQALTGVYREHHVAQYRYKKVKAAIDFVRKAGEIDDDLLDDAMIGEQAAVERLNVAVHGVWPVPAIRTAGRPPKVSHSARKRKDSFTPGSLRDNISLSTSETADDDVWTNIHNASISSPVAHNKTSRPTEGGKSLGAALFAASFNALADEYAMESKSDAGHQDEDENGVTEEDMCHFIHQVQRRELSQEEVFGDDPVDIESKPWLDVGVPLISKHKANLKAEMQMFVSNDEETAAAIAKGASLDLGLDDDGLRLATATTKDAGLVEVRVKRRLRSHGDGVMPKASAFVIPRKTFYVMKRVETRTPQSQDDVFGEVRPPIISYAEAPVGKISYSTLDRANSKAIEHFTKEVQFPVTEYLNMSERDTYINAAKENFLFELQQKGEKAMFDQTVEAEDESFEVRVWVEEGRLEGPRNF